MSLSSLQLDAFYRVAQDRSFSLAAKGLGVTQSALSQRILNLESDLETTLLIRDPAGLQLTESGQSLLRYCQTRAVLEDGFRFSLQSKDKKELAGAVRIAGFSSVNRSLLVPALSPLMKANDRLSLNLLTVELDRSFELLHHAQVDYLITTRSAEKEGIESILLGYEENVLVHSTKQRQVEIYLDHDERDRTTEAYLKLAKRSVRGIRKRYMGDVYGLIDGVRMGYGIAVLPKHLIVGESAFSILQPQIKLMVPVYLTFYTQPYYTQLHQAVLESIVQHFKLKLRQTS